MNRKIRCVLALLILSLSGLFAQEDEWYWNQPISRIEFEGLKTVKKNELSGVVSSYIGQAFTEETYTEVLDRLYELDLFEDIIPYARHDPKRASTVLLVLELVERPVIKSISFKGNVKFRNGELRDHIKIKVSDVFIDSKVFLDERELRSYYLSKGYTNATISHEIINKENGVEVVFNIKEGANTVISNISFSGNTVLNDRTLKSKIQLKPVGFLKDGAFQTSILEQDKFTILNMYKERGYADAEIVDVKTETFNNEEKQRTELSITFIIQEGARYTFAGIELYGNEVFSTEELLAGNKLQVGSIYNETKLQETLGYITNKYWENGYMSNEFLPSPLKDSEKHEISYKLSIKENARSHIENIIIKGNGKTKDFVIRREIPIQSGDVFSREKIITGLRNLMNLQYFSNVMPEPEVGSEQNLVNLVWNVEEQSTTSLQVGVTFSGVTDPTEIPISLFAKVQNSNLFGEGRSISASVTLSPTEQSGDLTYTQNWVGNIPLTYSQSVSFSHTVSTALINFWDPSLNLHQRNYFMKYDGFSASIGTAFARRWAFDYAILTASTGLSNSLTNYVYDENLYVPVDQGVSAYANRWGLTNSFYISGSVDNRNINYDPSKGWFASQKFAWYGLIPGLEKEFFLRSETKLEGYFKLCDIPVTDNWSFKLVLADYTGYTALFPMNSAISDLNRIYIDGMFNARGWTEAYKSTKGLAMFSNRLELRIPLVPNVIGLDGFWDMAYVKEHVNSSFANMKDFMSNMYLSFGPGIRILMPQFPLHFLFAFKYKYDNNGNVKWADVPFQFVLSFNLINR